MEALRREDETLQLKIIELIELAERFEREHDENLEQISRYENRLLETQIALKQIQDRKELYERRLEHMRGFSVLNEAFHIEINDQIGRINGLELGLLPGDKDPNWVHINSAFGNVMLIYSYLLRANGVEGEGAYPVEVCAFGYNSYFSDTDAGKKYFLMGPVNPKNLEGFNIALRYLVIFMKRLFTFFLNHFQERNLKVEELNQFLKIDAELKIDGFSLAFKLEKNFAKGWTKIMRLFLTNVKLLLLYQTKKEEMDLLAYLD